MSPEELAQRYPQLHLPSTLGKQGTAPVATSAGKGKQVTTPADTPAGKGKQETKSSDASAGKGQPMDDNRDLTFMPAPSTMPTHSAIQYHNLDDIETKLKRFLKRNLEAGHWFCTNIDGSRNEIGHLNQEQIRDICEETSDFMKWTIKEETNNHNIFANLPHSGLGSGRKRLRRMNGHIDNYGDYTKLPESDSS